MTAPARKPRPSPPSLLDILASAPLDDEPEAQEEQRVAEEAGRGPWLTTDELLDELERRRPS